VGGGFGEPSECSADEGVECQEEKEEEEGVGHDKDYEEGVGHREGYQEGVGK